MLLDRIESSTSLDRLDSTEKAIGSSISLADKQDHAGEKPELLSRPSNVKKVYALVVAIVLVGSLAVVLLGLCGVFQEDKEDAEGDGTAQFLLNSTYPPTF